MSHQAPQPFYPAGPDTYNPQVLEPSAQFKKEAVRVSLNIVLFIVVYLVLFVAALALAVGCIWAGFAIIGFLPKGFISLFGVGIMGLGVLVVWFLLKFLFAVSRNDTSGSLEITEAEQPRLFAFIQRLVDETGTHFPRKIYLTPDVNASVFYNSSFLSMFLPVRKNLNIGLGLVNTLNMAEFKAVLAHEFGHFSQRSMKLGTYVYQVNRVIYNMLYDNTGYDKLLQGFAKAHGFFALFANITVHIVRGIQKILQGFYQVINRSYMSLSRQMEFHADTVAATVAGGNHLVSALRRLELADSSYSRVVEQYNTWIPTHTKASNLYADHQYMIGAIANDFKIPLAGDKLPFISDEVLSNLQLSRIVYKNQWASHPERSEREAHLYSLCLTATEDHASAWKIFDNPEDLQAALTGKVYEQVQWEQDPALASAADFANAVITRKEAFEFPALYLGYYDNRTVEAFDVDALIAQPAKLKHASLAELAIDAHVAKVKKQEGNASDIELLRQMESGEIDVQSFDFDGTRYEVAQAGELRQYLEAENAEIQQELNQIDQQLFLLATANEGSRAGELAAEYKQLFANREAAFALEAVGSSIYELLQPLLQGVQVSIAQATIMVETLKGEKLPVFNETLNNLIGKNLITENRDAVLDFQQKNYVYFDGESFLDNELGELLQVIQNSMQEAALNQFKYWKQLLEMQAEMYGQ